MLSNDSGFESPLDLLNGGSEDVITILGDDVGTILKAIELNQLLVAVDGEGDEMSCDLVLGLSDGGLTLVGEAFVLILEFC